MLVRRKTKGREIINKNLPPICAPAPTAERNRRQTRREKKNV